MSGPLHNMTHREPASEEVESTASSSTGSDGGFSDWDEGLGPAAQTKSLFDNTILPSPLQAIAHDVQKHDVDLISLSSRLDSYQMIRLINLVRRDHLSPGAVKAIQPTDPRLKDDALLQPVIPDDPLLQHTFDDNWSDEEVGQDIAASSSARPVSREQLEDEISKARTEISRLKSLLKDSVGDSQEAAAIPFSVKGKGKAKGLPGRDDDTHYFDSYTDTEIHEIMLKDTVRTVSYGKFILSNPEIFKDAVVLDVGAGTGILSMFAAKSGARKVYAVEASALASKTKQNIDTNGLAAVIEVIQGKVEDIELPEKVDVIISEWMGYMLLYESMLDSVLNARDRFLKPQGLMAPSRNRLKICGVTGQKMLADRVDFWKKVYGFDLSPTNSDFPKEGVIEVVPAQEVVTDSFVLKDIDTHEATLRSLDFKSDFTIQASADCTIRAFCVFFDVIFDTSRDGEGEKTTGRPVPQATVAPQALAAEIIPDPSPNPVYFTTGPDGTPTHWQQVSFWVDPPVTLQKNEVIEGRFFCRKSDENSRELDVEMHFKRKEGGDKDMRIVMCKVR